MDLNQEIACMICGRLICPGLTSGWQAVFQSLEVKKQEDGKTGESFIPEKGALVPPSSVASELPKNRRYVHSCCWTIVTKVIGAIDFNQKWLDNFYKCLETFEPLTLISTDDAPMCDGENVYLPPIDYVDPETYLDEENIDFDPYSHTRPYIPPADTTYKRGVFDQFRIPDEIVQRIFSYLPGYWDIINLQFASNQAASPWVWLSLGRKYVASHPDPANTGTPQLSIDVRHALKNVECFADEYCGSANYADVWDAVEDLLYGLRRAPKGDDVGLRKHLALASTHNSLETFADTKEIKVPCVFSYVTLHSRRVCDHDKLLCGISIDTNLLGYRGNSSKTFGMGSIRGMHLAVRLGEIVSVRLLKFGADVMTDWIPALPRPLFGVSFLQIEPSNGKIRKIRASFESLIISDVLYATDQDTTMRHPFHCSRILPNHLLPPVYLADRSPLDFNTMNSVFFSDLSAVNAIGAYVMADNKAILALELAYINRTVLLGGLNMNMDPGSTKLSFHLHLDEDEVLAGFGCADATLNSGIAVQFITTLGRTVVFGDESAELWNFGPMTSGFFCAATTPNEPEKDYAPIRRAGVFSGPEVFKESYLQPTTWSTIDSSCFHQESKVFLSSASLKGVTWAIVYHHPDFGWLTGVQLIYANGPPIILGSMDEECMSLAIREPISRIRLFISTVNCSYLYHIAGITFTVGSRTTGAGNWDDDPEEMEIEQRVHDVPGDEIDPSLYWAFSYGGLACLSFTPDDDFVSDHPRLS